MASAGTPGSRRGQQVEPKNFENNLEIQLLQENTPLSGEKTNERPPLNRDSSL